MNEANDLRILCTRTPARDRFHMSTRLFTRTNAGWGESGLVPFDNPGEAQARSLINKKSALSDARDIEWGGASGSVPAAMDGAMRLKYLDAVRTRNRTSTVPAIQMLAAVPFVIRRK